MSNIIVLYDTEFTSWEGAAASDWAEPWQYKEIVQLAAMKVDLDSLEELETFNCLVQPQLNPTLSDYFIELTGITNEEVASKGVLYEVMYQKFINFVGDVKAYSYGRDDLVLHENLDLYTIQGLDNRLAFGDLHPFFRKLGVDPAIVNSGALAKYFKVDIDIHEHNAMDDVRSIFAALKHLKSKGVAFDF